MASALYTVYTLAVLVLAIAGLLFVFTRHWGPDESAVSRWGTVVALSVFLVALIVTTLSTA